MNPEPMKLKDSPMVEEPRIGVFVCDCGSNIAGHLDCSDVADYAATLPHVVYVKENLYTCSESGIGEIKKAITDQNLNRVVVASCSPRTHHPLFSSSCSEAGLNPYLFEMVNILDQCSWVHMGKRDKATRKAKELIRMGVAKSAGLEPQEEIESSLTRKIVVIGGGIAGLSAAQALSDMNLDVVLVEKTPSLGGLLQQVDLFENHVPARNLVSGIVEDLKSRSNVTLFTCSKVVGTSGYIGNYTVKIDTGDTLVEETVGSIVVAIGGVPFIPDALFGYELKNVITLMELEQRLKKNDLDAGKVVFIQCAGTRDEKREYCSRICCMIAVKNAMRIKENFPLTDVRVLYRDMQMYGTHKEQMLWDARGKGVRFDVYGADHPPEINPDSCVGCMACLTMCPYEAISFDRKERVCRMNEVLCKGCGNCAATCPSHSAQLKGYQPEQLPAQIGAA